jgi:hypothetical protein
MLSLPQDLLPLPLTAQEILDFKGLVHDIRELDLTDEEASDHAHRLVLFSKLVFTPQNSGIIEPKE